MYDSFAERPYCRSQAAVILEASAVPIDHRAVIAKEVGTPATAFVDAIEPDSIKVQFFSTVMELPMCGHGTVGLISHLVEGGLIQCGDDARSMILNLPKGPARVEYCRNRNGRVEVMLDVAIAQFHAATLDIDELAKLLDVGRTDFSDAFPPEIARADFVHLCLPMRDLSAVGKMRPDFGGLAAFCIANGIDTVATFSTEAADPNRNLHVRDFCPATGVAESAAAGTTNAALAGYLFRNGLIQLDGGGGATVVAEQGVEMGRPSSVTTRITTSGGRITRLQVGGVATRVMTGAINTSVGHA